MTILRRTTLRIVAVAGLMFATLFLFRNLLPEGDPMPSYEELHPEEQLLQYDFATGLFNTNCSVTLFGKKHEVHTAYRNLSERLFRFQNAVNRFDPKSELSRFNAAPANSPFALSEDFALALRESLRAAEETDGFFDITVGTLMDFWRRIAKSADAIDEETLRESLEEMRGTVGLDKIHLDTTTTPPTLTKSDDGIRLDFGGIAKGIALQIAIESLAKDGIDFYYLNFGGNTFQRLPKDHPNRDLCLLAETPATGEADDGRLFLKGVDSMAISTSANTHRPLSTDPKHPIGHILNPKTGTPVESPYLSVTAVTAPGSGNCDALSTAVFVAGKPLAEKLVSEGLATGFVLIPAAAGEPPEVIGELTLLRKPL